MTVIKADLCRANVYRGLADLYLQPPVDAEVLDTLEDSLGPLSEKIQSRTKILKDNQPAHQELLLEYTALFVGPGRLPAPPYGSVYLENRRIIMGDTTRRAAEHYKRAGLEVDFNQPPDFISIELEFMYYLICKYLDRGEKKFLCYQQEFFQEHLNSWIKQFVEKIVENSTLPFYKLLAEVTGDFICLEAKNRLNVGENVPGL